MPSLPKTILFIIFATTLSLSLKSKSHASLTTQPVPTSTPISSISNNDQDDRAEKKTEQNGPVVTEIKQKQQSKAEKQDKESSKQKNKKTQITDNSEDQTADNLRDEQTSTETSTETETQTEAETQESNTKEQSQKDKKSSAHTATKNAKKNEKKHTKQEESTGSEEEEESSSSEQDEQEEEKPIRSHASALPAEKPKQQYKKSVVVFVCIYGGIVVFVLVLIKMKAQESHAANMIDALLEMTIYRAMQFYFTKRNGYQPSTMNEEAGEDIDRGDSVAIGYSAEQGRELFWERNSATGI